MSREEEEEEEEEGRPAGETSTRLLNKRCGLWREGGREGGREGEEK